MAKVTIPAFTLLLLLSGCATNHAPDERQALACPFGTVEWADKDGRKCVRKFQMEQAIGW